MVLRNRYRVLRRLGSGGVGSVYLVQEVRRDGEAGARMALKALFSQGRGSEALLASLRQEFRVLATLRHPLIARVYDFGGLPADSGLEGSDGRPGYFFTRDLIDGQDLEARCDDLGLGEICHLCQRTAEVLDVLHRAGMVHGDFKPANVIVGADDDAPHLIDFGLVRSEGQSSMASGTAAYLSPELLRGQAIDRRADLYALGITVYQLVTGRLPLPEANLGQLINWHLQGDPLRPGAVVQVPEELDEVVARLTDRDPEQRYPSAAEAALALAEAAARAGAPRLPPRGRLFVPPAPGENLAAPLVELEEASHERTLRGGHGPNLIAVEGEPGAGKSTLLQELAWRCQLAGIEVVRQEFGAGDPRAYGAWFDLLDQVAGAVGLPHPLEQARSQDADRFALHQQISAFLGQAGQRARLLLLLDGLDQADAESVEIVRFVAHTLAAEARLMLVAAYRGSARLRDQLGQPPVKVLAALSVGDVERMVVDASGGDAQELGRQVHRHTGGNPRFVMEVLRRLDEAGWPASPDLQQLAPPTDLEAMYIDRWHALPEREQQVLLTLAVLGRPSSGQQLLQLLEQAGLEAQQELVGLPLEQLEAKDWLDRGPDGAYQFRQGPAARAIYDHVAPAVRRQLHRAAAQLLQGADADEAVEWTRHAVGAGDLELALSRLDQAVAALRGLGALRGAIQLYRDVLSLEPADPALRRRIHDELGRLHHAVGEYELAEAELTRACEGADAGALAATRLSLARVARAAGRAEQALALVQAVLDQQDETDGELAVDALAEAALTHLALDAHEQVLERVQQALGRLDQLADAHERRHQVRRAELLSQRAVALGYLQRNKEAAEAFEQALSWAQQCGDRRVEGRILNRWAILAFRRAAFNEGRERYGAALDCARHSGDVAEVATIRLNLATFHLPRGEYAACLEHLTKSLRLFEAMGALKSIGAARCNMGYIQLKVGLLEQARDSLRRAQQESRLAGRRSGEALALVLTGLVQGARGRLEQARDGVGAGRQLYLELGQRLDAADALFDLAEVELGAGEPEHARQAVEQACDEVPPETAPTLAVRQAVLEARIAAVEGSPQAQQRAWQQLEPLFATVAQLAAAELEFECHAAAMELKEALGQPEQAREHALQAYRLLQRMAHGLPGEASTAFWQSARRRAIRSRAARGGSVVVAGAGEAAPMDLTQPLPGVAAGAATPGLGSPGSPTPGAGETSAGGAAEGEWDAQQAADDRTLPGSISSIGGVTHVEERFYRLLEIYRQINSELDHERLLGLVMDNAVELTGAERGFLLLGQSPDELQVEVARNIDPQAEGGAFSRSIAEQVFSSGQPVVTVSAHNDPRFEQVLSVHQLQLESVLCIPIHARDRTVGVLYMESRFQSGRFTPADQRLLMAFGDQVAIALTNARLLADNMRKAEDLARANAEIEALAEERGQLLSQRTEQLEQAKRDLAETRARLQTRVGLYGMVGRSQAMTKLFALMERVASTDVPVLIEGESGTGKEMVARGIHGWGARKKARLVSVNCAAIPENLLESELFGHVRGAFTGADRERKGLFMAADHGTLFLDEIGDMPMRMQVDLLRALQEKMIRPVGAQRDIQVDVRVIAASNKPLVQLIEAKRFREDLYYRLNVVTLHLPPLRERADDIPLLCDHFLARNAEQMRGEKKRLTRRALRALMDYSWPGNVRQLEHALMNASVLADGDVLDADDFTLEAPRSAPAQPQREAAPAPASSASADPEDRRQRDRQRILKALEACSWNKTRAASRLGIPRRTFYRRLKEHGIQ